MNQYSFKLYSGTKCLILANNCLEIVRALVADCELRSCFIMELRAPGVYGRPPRLDRSARSEIIRT